MTAYKDRTGDFTKKKHLYKFYKNGYTSRNPKYVTAGQYLGFTGSFVSGTTSGSAYVDGSISENNLNIFGSGDSNVGLSATYKVESDARRKLDLTGLIMSFSHGGGSTSFGQLYSYDIVIFDYTIRYTTSGNTLKFFYKTTELASVTMSSSYNYLRLRELGGTLYIDRSSDGVTWTNWSSRVIDPATDILRSTFSMQAVMGAGGNGNIFAYMNGIDAADRHNNLLAVETKVLNDFEFDESINNPASVTNIVLPYSPLNIPAHCDEGNFVEIYTNFYDDGVIKYEPILDHNGAQILDHNDQPITGVVLHGNVPEESNILKFSGYISNIDDDYDGETIALRVVSHGETMANSLVRDGNTSVPIISQLTYDSVLSSVERRQTFTITKNTKLDSIQIRASYGAGGSSNIIFGQGNRTLGFTKTRSWSGGLGEGLYTYDLTQPLYLEAGVYWWQETGGINVASNQATNPYSGGARQYLLEGAWTNLNTCFYFVLYSTQLQTAVNLAGNAPTIAQSIFSKSLALDYSPLYLAEAQDNEYTINIGLNLDNAKNAFAALYRQLPTGWFYNVNVGTGALKIKNKNSVADHLLMFGRDFTEMKVSRDIDGIINDVYYVGAPLIENGPKLTVRSFDVESMGDLRQGLSIQTNDKVTRYDTATILSQNIIGNNNGVRITTEITLSAAKYNVETIRSGDVVKIVNGSSDVLGLTLVVATVRYVRGGDAVTISLDSAPRNISRTIDAINRQLENMQTANAGLVV